MTQPETAIGRFFDRFVRQSSQDDVPAIVSHFADPFISVGPHGSRCAQADDLAAALSQKKALFDRLGAQPAILTNLQETQLDPRYVLARTTWRMCFVRDSAAAQEILVDSTFLVDTGADEFKIVMYLNHQDIMQILRDRGLIGS